MFLLESRQDIEVLNATLVGIYDWYRVVADDGGALAGWAGGGGGDCGGFVEEALPGRN